MENKKNIEEEVKSYFEEFAQTSYAIFKNAYDEKSWFAYQSWSQLKEKEQEFWVRFVENIYHNCIPPDEK